jgi:hypothetical protein
MLPTTCESFTPSATSIDQLCEGHLILPNERNGAPIVVVKLRGRARATASTHA